ncbi:MAG: TetR/AcrR family transcriptional regulator [Polyangiaceae bacterium]
MSAKQEQKARTHAAILTSAAELLRSKGISGAKVADVMAGAGLTVGGFYAHFASKQALVDETIRRTAGAIRTRLFQDLEQKPAEARALVVLKRYLSAAHRDAPETGCPLPAIAAEVSSHSPEHRDVLVEQLELFASELSNHLPAGKQRRATALALIALMYGGLSLARATAGTPLSDEILKACRGFARLEG